MLLDAELSSQPGVKEKAPGTYWRLQKGLSVRRRQIFASQYLGSTLSSRTDGPLLRGAGPNASPPQALTLALWERGVGFSVSVPFFCSEVTLEYLRKSQLVYPGLNLRWKMTLGGKR